MNTIQPTAIIEGESITTSKAPTHQNQMASANKELKLNNQKAEAVKAELQTQSNESEAIRQKSASHLSSLQFKLEEAIEVLNESLARTPTSAKISRDETLNRYVVRITEKQSGEIVKEIPSEELLKFARHLEKLKGILFDGLA